RQADYMAFDGGPFDLIVTDGVLHLIPGDTRALFDKLSRDLRAGGVLVCCMPYDSAYNRAFAVVRRAMRACRGAWLDALILALARGRARASLCRRPRARARARSRIAATVDPADSRPAVRPAVHRDRRLQPVDRLRPARRLRIDRRADAPRGRHDLDAAGDARGVERSRASDRSGSERRVARSGGINCGDDERDGDVRLRQTARGGPRVSDRRFGAPGRGEPVRTRRRARGRTNHDAAVSVRRTVCGIPARSCSDARALRRAWMAPGRRIPDAESGSSRARIHPEGG